MICRACKRDHNPMLTCQRAARLSNTQVDLSNKDAQRPSALDKPAKFDKVAYQREYMRKRRAAAK